MTTYTLTIPAWRPASVNELLRSVRSRIRLKKRDRAFIVAYARLAAIPPATLARKVSLTITLTGRQRPADADAFWKSLLDALTHAGLLVDDDAAHVQLGGVTFRREQGQGGTEIILEDLTNGQ
jgi:Holliday junction resolvase RusA-like endonuclease